MEPITFVIKTSQRPDGRFDAYCENMPEQFVCAETREEATGKAVEAVRRRAKAIVLREAELNATDKQFLSDASRISTMHRGAPEEWLPLMFDEEGVSLGEPASTPKVVSIQFATYTGSVPNRPSEPIVRELREFAG